MSDQKNLELCAEVGYEVLRRFKATIGLEPGPIWLAAAPATQAAIQESARYVIGQEAHPKALHEWWVRRQTKLGWSAGIQFDADKKVDPILQDWKDLVLGDRVRFSLFRDIVSKLWHTLRNADWSVEEAIQMVLDEEEPSLRVAPELMPRDLVALVEAHAL